MMARWECSFERGRSSALVLIPIHLFFYYYFSASIFIPARFTPNPHF